MEISPADRIGIVGRDVDATVDQDADVTVEETATMALAADVTNRNLPAAADRKMDADVHPQNLPVRLRQDLRDRLMKTAGDDVLSDKKDQSVMPWSSFSLTSYK